MKKQDMDPAVQNAIRTLVDAARKLETDPRTATRRVGDASSALEALDTIERALFAHSPSEHYELLLDVRAARADILAYELSRQRSMLPLLTDALARLRTTSTIDDLVESIPVESAGLGYERAMFSWVHSERWVPRSMYTTSGPEEGRSILQAGAPPYQHTRDLMEVDVVRKRRPILVLDADTNPRVHPKITPVSRSSTYVAAPVVARDHVAAFVHVDRNSVTGTTDEFDRDLLSYFCESIGVMLDRLVAAKNSVEEAVPNSPVSTWIDALTAREREVLRLLATGLTNSQIGARLFISEETTKTHVKKLMRKLGVNNRSQAGAMYHRLQSVDVSESSTRHGNESGHTPVPRQR
ncbi:helix-turn-helix transcriptional regulator [Rhodococcus opacus]|uniref:helix-turn-helix transcriptional regulator n=1 Tax=Rhodococcus opacus TaxID=37919 RepID=UPI001C48DB2B|nr:LuxR C-terminal-related transcriptional regulator [Rhodococcus opacus]MBV6755114.1 LuxR C-terminal-related transcriptional regulator [Rhodococcus opacus]